MRILLCAVVLAVQAAGAADLPALVGDGVHDDTAAIQARLDAGASCVYLPPPAKEYLISKALELSSEGLASNPDILHFDTPSVRTLGVRYAEAMRGLRGD